uniref:AB hydrolase-1 domain-containing protein n=1 Tax=Clastoptera arizonana TaxID=38151 RepID=A0A1B6CNS7_9HEMI
MALHDCKQNIVSVPLLEILKIHYLSFLWGLWCFFKLFIKKMCFFSKNSDQISDRGKPPICLVDTTLGQHSYVKLKGVKLHYVECGNRDKPVLLLLHGFPDFWISWRYQIPVLSKYYRVIALDLKGFGDSDKPSSRWSYRLEKILNELHDLIVAIGGQRCTVIAHDLGALLGWYLVHMYPQMIEKFVTLSCPHPNLYWTHLPHASSFNKNWIHYSQLPYLPETEALNNDLNIINKCYQHLTSKTNHEPYLNAYKYCFSRKEDWSGPINYYRNLPFSRINAKKKVDVPSMLLVGTRDSSVTLESVIKSTDYLDKFVLKVVDGAKHFPHQEYPEIVNEYLLSFLVGPKPSNLYKGSAGNIMYRMVDAVSSTAVRYGSGVLMKTANTLSSKTF